MKQSKLLVHQLATIALSMFSAGCLIILVVFVPAWQESDPAKFLDWFSDHGKTIGMIMLPLEIAPLMLTLISYVKFRTPDGGKRIVLLLANICNFTVLYMFIVHFLPINASFMDNSMPLEKVPAALKQWEFLHTLRTILSLLAVIFSILALPGRLPGASSYSPTKTQAPASSANNKHIKRSRLLPVHEDQQRSI